MPTGGNSLMRGYLNIKFLGDRFRIKRLRLLNFSLSLFYFIGFCAKYNNYKFICTPEFQSVI